MSCDSLREPIAQYAAGDADLATRRRVEQHLTEGCESCQKRLDELVDAYDLLTRTGLKMSSPPRSTVQRIWTELNRRMDADVVVTSDSEQPVRPVRQRSTWAKRLAPVLATACGFLLVVTFPDLGSDRVASSGVAPETSTPSPAESTAEESSPDSVRRLVSVHRRDEPASMVASLWVDRLARQVHLHADRWPRLPGDHQYVVWAIVDDQNFYSIARLDTSGGTPISRVIDLPADQPLPSRIAVAIDGVTDPLRGADNDNQPLFVSDDFGDWITETL